MNNITLFFANISEWFNTAWGGICTSFVKTFIREDRYKLFLQGFKNTITIAFFATLIGVAIGLLVAIVKAYHVQTGKIKFLNWICNLYTTIIRGTPIVVQLMITYFIIFASSDNDIGISIITFGINSGAYVSEIIRGGIAAIDKGQTEAGQSLGLSRVTTLFCIVLPQALRNVLPALGNEFIALLKETSVAGYLAICDLTKAGEIVRSRTLEPYFSLLSVALVYLILVIGMEKIFLAVERRFSKSDKS